MGYLSPKSGSCKVLDKSSDALDNSTKQKVALLFEGFLTYEYLSILEFERFLSAFYPKWDSQIYNSLIKILKLNKNQKLSSMSLGQRSQVVLASLFAQNAEF